MSEPSEAQRAARASYDSGLSLREVARKHALTSPAAAKRAIQAAGGTMRPSGFDHQRSTRRFVRRRFSDDYRGADVD